MLPFNAGYIQFKCRGRACVETVKVWVRPALIHSQTGQQVPCKTCGTWYCLTENAVLQIAAPDQKFLDAEGNPYGHQQPGTND